jgi:hypothetical protein
MPSSGLAITSTLAGFKLSMIIDNLIAKRHDCFVTMA